MVKAQLIYIRLNLKAIINLRWPIILQQQPMTPFDSQIKGDEIY